MGHQIKDFCFFSDWLLTVLVVEFLWWWIFHEIRGKWFNYYYVLCVAFEASPALPPVFYIGKFCGGRRVHWTTLNLVCKCMSVFYAMLCRWTIYTRCLPYILVRGTKNEVKKKKKWVVENYKEGPSKALVVEPNQVGPSGHVNFHSNC